MICNCLRKLIPAIALPFLSACAPQKTPYAELPKVSEAEVRRYAEQSVSLFRQHGTQEICGLDSGNDLAINEIPEQLS